MHARQAGVTPLVAHHNARHAQADQPEPAPDDPAKAQANLAEKDQARVAPHMQIVAQRLGQGAVQARLYALGLGLLPQPIVHAVRLFSTSKCTHTG